MKEILFSITKKDFDVQTFRSGGKGGQHQNKVETGVRIIHRDSGAVGESRSERSQLSNKKLALQRLAKSSKFRLWWNQKVHEVLSGQTIEQRVEKSMDKKNLIIEIKNSQDRWEEVDEKEYRGD